MLRNKCVLLNFQNVNLINLFWKYSYIPSLILVVVKTVSEDDGVKGIEEFVDGTFSASRSIKF